MTIGAAFRFESFKLDIGRLCLIGPSGKADLRPKSFDVLRHLVEHAGRLITKEELIKAVWPDVTVTDESLTQCISEIRRVLGDKDRRIIKTVPRRGYLMDVPVLNAAGPLAPIGKDSTVEFPLSTDPVVKELAKEIGHDALAASEPALVLPDKPSVAVLPFQNLSGDPEQAYFADGMVEEIITALSRTRWLFVIARNSTFVYKWRTVDVRQVGRELGVRYVLEGSIRKSGTRVRISCQLIDAISGAHLWADHFDGSLSDVFDLQDRIAVSVVGVIEPALVTAEICRSIQRRTTDVPVYDLYLRARAESMTWQKSRLFRALDLLGRALELDPHYGPALALAAQCHQNLDQNGWSEQLKGERQQSVELARRAIRASNNDPYVLGEAAFVLGYFEHEIDPALTLIDRSLELNPSSAIAWFRSGWLRLWAGKSDLGIEHFENSRRLNPLRPGPPSFGIAVGYFLAGCLERAVMMLRLSLEENPTWPPCYRFLASCCAHLGRLDEARAIVNRLKDITPLVIPGAEHWRVPEQREFFLAGLRLAAGEAA